MSKKEKLYPINTFGGRIQHRRTQILNLSRAEFYDLVHPNDKTSNDKVSRESKNRTIKNWESGQNDPDLATLRKICAVLNCTADYLLGADNAQGSGIAAEAGTFSAHTVSELSSEASRQLQQLAHEDPGGTRIRVINDLLHSTRFAYDLTGQVYDYYLKYSAYLDSEETYTRERRELDRLTEGDVLKEIALLRSGAFTQTVGKRQVAELKDIAEAARFKIQKEMDQLSEELAQNFSQQKKEVTKQLFNHYGVPSSTL